MRVLADTQPYRRGFRIPAGVNLRECSVVIIGSTCKICGRDFKCESDVALHKRWRHLAIGSLLDSLENELRATENTITGRKCDVCDMYFETISDWRMHKRQVHKHRRRPPRRRTVRVRFKLDGVTMTDVTLDRKYLKMQSVLRYFVDVGTQTESLENEKKRQDDRGRNIDLSLLPGHAADNDARCDVRPHKATNRYIVGKFTSTRSTATVGRSLAEISNTEPRREAISSGDEDVENGPREDLVSRKDKPDAVLASLVDDVNIQDKENSRVNAQERRNVYCQSEILVLDECKTLSSCQPDKSSKTAPVLCKQSSGSSVNLCRAGSVKQSHETGMTGKIKLSSNGLTNSFDVMDVDANDNNNSFDGIRVTMKRSSAPFRLNDKNESPEINTSVDDDVQEVLRIMRGNVQNDINHESPNRTEREILVQNAINEMRVLSAHRGSNDHHDRTEKHSAKLLANGIEPSNYSSFTSIAEGSYQFLAEAFNKKLGICLKDLHHYGISYYNDLPEINNNLEDYEMYAHDGFLVEPWMQAAGSQYIAGLKANDIEATVNLE